MEAVDHDENQSLGNVDENGSKPPISGVGEELFSPEPLHAKCEICGAETVLTGRQTVPVCSTTCRRERTIRYHRNYRHRLREGLDMLRKRFGDRMPSEAEVEAFIEEYSGRDET